VATTVQATVNAKSLGLFSGIVSSLTCDVTPAGGPTCGVTPGTFTLGAGASHNLTVNFSNTGLTGILPNNYAVNLVATSSATNPGPGTFYSREGFYLGAETSEAFCGHR